MKRPNVQTSKRQNGRRDREITRKLIGWFKENERPLPWRIRTRGKRCAWAAMVAEAMLQQTQVTRVVERFRVFIERFPRPADLASSHEQEVLALWQGLGYYRRARLLHQAAKLIVDRFGGRVPRDVGDLLQLPGVGRYTAGAIASIAFGQAEPIVDGNVHRVLARLEAQQSAADDRGGLAWTWQRAAALVKVAEEPGAFNEALMELGSTVCTPRNPNCASCPFARHCKAKRANVQHDIPSAKKPAARKAVHHHAVIIRRSQFSNELFFEQRPATGLWAGMWQIPTIESDAPLTLDQLASQLRLDARSLANGGMFEHHTSHRRITFHVLTATSRRSAKSKGVWREPGDVSDLPMSNAQRRILREYVLA